MSTKTANLNISLPAWMKKQVEQAAVDLGFANTSEYARSLFREARARRQKEEFDQSLIDGMNEPATEFTEADWEEFERPIREARPDLFKS
jgi:Arc/MetJ-type ribon-helix-helix transcriptional regulator